MSAPITSDTPAKSDFIREMIASDLEQGRNDGECQSNREPDQW